MRTWQDDELFIKAEYLLYKEHKYVQNDESLQMIKLQAVLLYNFIWCFTIGSKVMPF